MYIYKKKKKTSQKRNKVKNLQIDSETVVPWNRTRWIRCQKKTFGAPLVPLLVGVLMLTHVTDPPTKPPPGESLRSPLSASLSSWPEPDCRPQLPECSCSDRSPAHRHAPWNWKVPRDCSWKTFEPEQNKNVVTDFQRWFVFLILPASYKMCWCLKAPLSCTALKQLGQFTC